MSGLEHYGDELQALDQRIGRLALLCEADLTRHETIMSLIRGDFAACPRVDALSLPRLRELRGLLMLRYRIEEKCLADLGAEACVRLIEDEQARLRRSGMSTLPNS